LKHLFILSILMFATNVGFSQEGTSQSNRICQKYYYDSGELKTEGCWLLQDSTYLKDGVWINYYKNKNICNVLNYSNNVLFGLQKEFSENAVLSSTWLIKHDTIPENERPKPGLINLPDFPIRPTIYHSSIEYSKFDNKGRIIEKSFFKDSLQVNKREYYKNGNSKTFTLYFANGYENETIRYNRIGKERKFSLTLYLISLSAIGLISPILADKLF